MNNIKSSDDKKNNGRYKGDFLFLTMQCPICVETPPPSAFVSCPSCQSSVCHKCIRIFCKTMGTGDIHCMTCKFPWERSFAFRALPPSMMHSTMKTQREETLYDLEKAKLPATMALMALDAQRAQIQAKIEKLRVQISALQSEEYKCVTERDHLRAGMASDPTRVKQTKLTRAARQEQEKHIVVCQCPKQDCRGYVMKGDMKCGLCSVLVCKACQAIVLEISEHTCNPSDVASLKLIQKDCKQCPGCRAPSRKVEGCNQVWCICCKQAWNWETREIIQGGNIHATDYFNYMRANPQAVPLGAACGDGARMRIDVARHLPRLRKAYPKVVTAYIADKISHCFRVTEEYIGDRPRVKTDDCDLRIAYLNGEIDENRWKSLLHMRDKQFTLNAEIQRLRKAFQTTMRELLVTLCSAENENEVIHAVNDIRSFHNIMRDEFFAILKCFHSKRSCPFHEFLTNPSPP